MIVPHGNPFERRGVWCKCLGTAIASCHGCGQVTEVGTRADHTGELKQMLRCPCGLTIEVQLDRANNADETANI